MDLKQVAKDYAAGLLSKEEARELVQSLDLPVYDSHWDGQVLLSGDKANDPLVLVGLRADGDLPKEQFEDIRSFFPKGYRRTVATTAWEKELTGDKK